MSVESIRVLHVDDDQDFAELASTFIENSDSEITIEVETDPRDCIDRLAHEHQSIDCIVSDYEMPHLTGLEMLEAVREEYPEFPFILFTGKGSEEIAAEAISKGVNDYMQKQMGTDQYQVLANRIRHHVQQVRTERALRNSEAKYRALVEQNIVGIYIIQDGDTLVYVNPKLAEIFGYTRSEVIGQSTDFLVAENSQDRVKENLRKRLNGDVDTVRYRFTGESKSGEELDILVQGQRIELNGEPTVAGVLLDLDSFQVDDDA